jgi:hypothetical protein
MKKIIPSTNGPEPISADRIVSEDIVIYEKDGGYGILMENSYGNWRMCGFDETCITVPSVSYTLGGTCESLLAEGYTLFCFTEVAEAVRFIDNAMNPTPTK